MNQRQTVTLCADSIQTRDRQGARTKRERERETASSRDQSGDRCELAGGDLNRTTLSRKKKKIKPDKLLIKYLSDSLMHGKKK